MLIAYKFFSFFSSLFLEKNILRKKYLGTVSRIATKSCRHIWGCI